MTAKQIPYDFWIVRAHHQLEGASLALLLRLLVVPDVAANEHEDNENNEGCLREDADFNQAYAFSLIRQLYEEATPAAFSLIETRADEAKSLWTEATCKDFADYYMSQHPTPSRPEGA